MIPKARYCGPFADYTGYGQATRNAITALYKVGVPITTERVSFVNRFDFDLGPETKTAKTLERSPNDNDYQVRILHVTADIYYNFFHPQKYNIGHLFWETDRIPASWVRNCNLMHEIWTGTEGCKKALINSGVKVPIYIFPQATNTDVNDWQSLPNIKPPGSYLFYNISEWNQRKNPLGLLRAFWDTFTNKDEVMLLLKVHLREFTEISRKQIEEDVSSLKSFLGKKDLPEVYMITEAMDYGTLKRLHKTGDCFVSCHRGEGWGIPTVDALLTGNPVISTDFGGVNEYLDSSMFYPLNYKLVSVKGMNNFNTYYTPDQNWADPDYTHLKHLMKKVFKEQSEAKELAETGKRFIEDNFSFEKIGLQMASRLEKIAEEKKWNNQ
jgi:glycosyltransferase involved in cell wall biosynthesis